MRSPAFTACLWGALVLACSSDTTTTPPDDDQPGPAASLQVVEGDQQTGLVGTELTDPLIVLLTDAGGRAISGRAVTFVVASGGGALLVPTATTDARGRAANRWTLGTSTGEVQRAEARLVDAETGRGFTAPFTATAIAGDPAGIEKVEGDGQLGHPATRLSDWLGVAVVDRHGNPVADASVTWTATGGGVASPASSTTDVLGLARTRWTLGPSEDETQTLSASVGSDAELPPVTFTAEFFEVSVDFGAGRWEAIADVPFPIRAAAPVTYASRIYLFGGSDDAHRRPYTLIYDPDSDSWSRGADMPMALDFAFAATASDGIHVFGGTSDAGRSHLHWVYDPDADSWDTGPALPIGVSGASGETVDDAIIVIGGVTGSRLRHAEVQIFDPTAVSWTFGPLHPAPHLNAASELLNRLIYVLGGNLDPMETSDAVHALDVSAGTWEALTPMPVQREQMGLGTTRGSLCFFGGRHAQSGGFNTPFADAFCYDFSSERWREVASLPAARAEIASVSLDGWIYAIGGHDAFEEAQRSAWRFTGIPAMAAPPPDRDPRRASR